MLAKRFGWSFIAGFLLVALLWCSTIFTAVRLAPNVEESWVEPILAIKKSAALAKTGKRLFYVSGSSGLYGADTPTFEQCAAVPFVNLGTFGGLGLEAMCDDVLDVARPGDAVLLALENDLYAFDPFHENLIRHTFRCHPQKLWGAGFPDLPAYFLSLRFGEIRDRWIYHSRLASGQPVSVAAAGFVTTVDANGDKTVNVGSPRTGGKSLATDLDLKPPTPESLKRLEMNVQRLRKRGLTVFATTQPKLFNANFDATQVAAMRRPPAEIYRRNEVPYFTHSFSASVNEALFYDSDNHLNRDGAVPYSREVASLLAGLPGFIAWKNAPSHQ